MAPVVIIGGGVAGTTCADYVNLYSNGKQEIMIISPKDMIKTTTTLREVTKNIKELNLNECDKTLFEERYENVTVKVSYVSSINTKERLVITSDDEKIPYSKLCICTGAKPSVIEENNPFVIFIRDTDTAADLKEKLSSARKVVVVGNGGIALELVYEISDCEVYWCIKNDAIGNTFFDKGAATFLVPSLENCNGINESQRKSDKLVFKRKKHEKLSLQSKNKLNVLGTSLGPDWNSGQKLSGAKKKSFKRNVKIFYSCEVTEITSTRTNKNDKWNVYVTLSTGETIGADFVVSATGVLPNCPIDTEGDIFEKCPEGGIYVGENMQTNIKDIYAAGDVCTPRWDPSDKWFPMKLWTQACQMGAFAGRCIASHLDGQNDIFLDLCFELFTHATTFFGYKVCLLGDFNAKNSKPSDLQIIFRCTPGVEYVKVILKNGRMQGCVLIGETNLEETFENLILNDFDLSFLGESLLDPDVDIDDYFD